MGQDMRAKRRDILGRRQLAFIRGTCIFETPEHGIDAKAGSEVRRSPVLELRDRTGSIVEVAKALRVDPGTNVTKHRGSGERGSKAVPSEFLNLAKPRNMGDGRHPDQRL